MPIAFPSLSAVNAFTPVTPTQVATPLSVALEHSIQQEREAAKTHLTTPLSQRPAVTLNEVPERAALQRSAQDLLGHFRELQHATRSELNQTRTAVEQRLDELAAALHTDMRRVRSETRSETETLHKDLFHSATTLSHVQDRLSRLETAFNALLQNLSALEPGPSTPARVKADVSGRTVLKPLAR